eukprot:CAMPEP_0202859500 /NCGR_PEP_ID=MMETSP1391-20130828/1584_1 /ASSEMBLY_ACC=CAM_ASM_000867 /TAXON_ID=1034604 /ORGANISM="Chlamydomonas leiostraca, Strain SAG 11-49" /LENGTH=66 /DNA_ID=CAMNT_0049538535 /DNA_START=6 /DNA_END=206 /DNA_ORIENTATION=-
MAVRLGPEIALGVAALVSYNLIFAAVGLVNGFHIPEKFYLFARGWYALYFAAACVLGIREMWTGEE